MRSPQRRKRLSMTSLIDVIFLLLLFFMLSSTFSRFAEVELVAPAGAGGTSQPPSTDRAFLRLSEQDVSLNGRTVTPKQLRAALGQKASVLVLVSLQSGVSAQRLTDVLVTLRGVPSAEVVILEPS